jgi:hypothetical protein
MPQQFTELIILHISYNTHYQGFIKMLAACPYCVKKTAVASTKLLYAVGVKYKYFSVIKLPLTTPVNRAEEMGVFRKHVTQQLCQP